MMLRSRLAARGLALAMLAVAGCATDPAAPPSTAPAAISATAAAVRAAAVDPALSGTWVPVAAELSGQHYKFGQEFRLVVRGDRYEIFGTPQKDSGRLVFVGGDPKGFDVLGEEGPSKGLRFPVIYRFLPDGRLQACYDLSGEARPAAFVTHPETKLFLVIYRRG